MDKITTLYNILKKDGYSDIGTESQFRNAMKDKNKAKTLYDTLKKDGYSDIGTNSDVFYNGLNPAQKVSAPKPKGNMLTWKNSEQNYDYLTTKAIDETLGEKFPLSNEYLPSKDIERFANADDKKVNPIEAETEIAKAKYINEHFADDILQQNKDITDYGINIGRTKEKEIAPEFNYDTGKFEKKYLTPFGKYNNKVQAEHDLQNYRIETDTSSGAQLGNAYNRLAEVEEKLAKRGEELLNVYKNKKDKEPFWDRFIRGLALGQTPLGEEVIEDSDIFVNDAQYQSLKLSMRNLQDQIQQLKNYREKEQFEERRFHDFQRNFWQPLLRSDSWDFGKQNLQDAITMLKISEKYENGTPLTEEEKTTLQELANTQDIMNQFGDLGKWATYGDIAGSSTVFAKDMLITGSFEGLTTGLPSKLATKIAINAIKKAGIDIAKSSAVKAAKEGIFTTVRQGGKGAFKKLVKEIGVKSLSEMALVKGIGITAEDMLLRAPLMVATVGQQQTMADIGKHKIGNVVDDGKGELKFENKETWGNALYQTISDNVIEYASEMWGAHQLGAVDLSAIFGARNLTAAWLKATREGAGTILSNTNKFLKRLGINGYIGEASEEYVGQLWRTAMNLDSAKDQYGRNNLFSNEFHSDLWVGTLLSIGTMSGGTLIGGTTIKGVSSVIDGVKTYNRLKRNIIKTDIVTSNTFQDGKWDEIRKRIDTTTNDNIGSLAKEIANSQELSAEQKGAVMNYMEASLIMRGFNLKEQVLHNNGIKPTKVENQIIMAYMNGYNEESGQKMQDAKNMYAVQLQRVLDELGESDLQLIESAGYQVLELNSESSWNDEQRKVVNDFLIAKAVYEGILQQAQDASKNERVKIGAMWDNRTHTNGSIYEATTSVGEKVFAISGNLAFNDDGTINTTESDQTIVVINENGEKSQIPPKDLTKVTQSDANKVKEEAIKQAQEQLSQTYKNQINGTITTNNGDSYDVYMKDGSIVKIVITPNEQGLTINQDNTVNVSINGGEVVPIALETLQSAVDNYRIEQMKSREHAREANNAQVDAMEQEVDVPNNTEQPTSDNKFDRAIPMNEAEAKSLIRQVVAFAKTVKDKVKRVVIGGITDRQKQDLANNGLKIDNTWVHSVENFAILHNQKNHGNSAVEENRGQIAITEEDYQLIPNILETYDNVSISPNKDAQGNEVVVYTKEYPNGTIYYLEEVRNKRKSLAFKTMYKKKKGIDSSDGLMSKTSPFTSKTTPDNLNSDDKGNELTADNQATEQENVANQPKYDNGRISYTNQNGKEVKGLIVDTVTEDNYDEYGLTIQDVGKRVFYDSEKPNELQFATDAELDAMGAKFTPEVKEESKESQEPRVENKEDNNVPENIPENSNIAEENIPTAEDAAKEQEVTQTEPDQTAEAEQAVEQMPVDKDGEPIFSQTTPERGHAYIFGEAGLTREQANEFVANNAAKAQKDLDNINKKQPKMGTSIVKFKQQQAEWQQKVEEAQATVDYWNNVKETERAIEEAEKQEAKAKAAEEQAKLHDEAVAQVEQEKIAKVQAEAERPTAKTEQADNNSAQISNDVDENGHQFVIAPNGSTNFGEISDESGLQTAPIKLSVGFQDKTTGKGYGLAHIEANHGEQIRQAGFNSVEEFVSFVAENYDPNNIRVGKKREDGQPTFLIQYTDTHDNTLFIELSRDGSYWNVNSGGIFRKGYSNKKETVAKTEPQQPTNAISSGSSLSKEAHSGISSSEPNGEPTVSNSKGTEQEEKKQISDVKNTQQGKENAQTDNRENPVQKSVESEVAEVTETQRQLGEAVTEVLKDNGIEVVTDEAEMQKVLADGNGQHLKTPTGEVYGFVKDGKIYLDPKVMNANTPIHEYTHLWDNAVQKANPKLWERGVELLKQTPLWEQVKNDPAYADIANDDNLLASEVHSRLSGKEGAKMLDDMVEQAKKKGALETAKAISLKEQVKKWFRDLYTWVRDAFGKWSAADLESLSLDEFVKMPIKVLASGRNMKDLMHKAEQTAIVRENNPAEDDYHTWVRNANDVKTFDEMLAEAERDFAEYGDMTYPDMTIEQLREAKETGYITVYSSKPIKLGIFVTPSRMNAEDYAGGGKVYSKRVPTSSVAWIGQDEGQLADTGRKKITNTPTQMMFIGEKGTSLDIEQKNSFKGNRAARMDKSKQQSASVVSSEAVAKIANDFEIAAKEYEKYPHRSKGFISTIAQILKMDNENDGVSKYVNIELPNGDTITVRDSNHNGKVSRFDERGENNVISLVFSKHRNLGLKGKGDANVVEFYYDVHKLDKDKGAYLPTILRDIASSLTTGEYANTAPADYVNTTYTNANGERKTRIETSEQYAKRKATEKDNLLFRTSEELFDEYPTWLSGQTTSTGQHTTQITSTQSTYKKIGEHLAGQSKKPSEVSILDASSGLGVGTQALRDMGFSVDDVEPYPSEKRVEPTFRKYEDVNKKYDVVISNAVLNVIPDDWRADVLKNMADKLNIGGKLIINVRDAAGVQVQKQKIELDSPSEILVTDKKGNIRAYQKGFTVPELLDYVQSQLGDAYTVERANKGNSGLNGMTAVVVTRNDASPLNFREVKEKSQSLSEQEAFDQVKTLGKEHFYDNTTEADNKQVARYLSTRSDARELTDELIKHKGTTWAKAACKSLLVRTALDNVLNGRPLLDSGALNTANENLLKDIAKRGVDAIFEAYAGKLIGKAAKAINNVNSSLLNCRPSEECAKYCYASKGNYLMSSPLVKSELVDYAIETDPVRAAELIANEYKATRQSLENKALRLFDKGDMNDKWLSFIDELNKRGVVCQIFSKRPELLTKVNQSLNIVSLSVDKSNMELAHKYPDLPLAFVYSGTQDLEQLNSQRDRFIRKNGVILPVKLGRKLLDGSDIKELPKWAKPYTCPVDAGKVTIKKKDELKSNTNWNCTNCDNAGGVGCFFNRTAKKLIEEYERRNSSGQNSRDNISTTTGDARSSSQGLDTLSDTNGDRIKDQLRRGILRDAETSGIPTAYISAEFLEKVVDRIFQLGSLRNETDNIGTRPEPSTPDTSVSGQLSGSGERLERATDNDGLTDPTATKQQAKGLAAELNTPVRFVENAEEITHEDAERQMRMRKSKGWFNPKTGEVVIVLPNNKDAADVAETIFHEIVAHKGLRELVGEKNFTQFLHTVYEHATEDVRKRIAEKARKFGYDFEKATDEYLADLAEKGFEDFTEGERTIWQKLKQIVLDAINKFLETMNLPKWVKLGDNELRYMLWRSHENLRAGKESPLQKAADIAKREELGMNDDMRFRGGETDDVWRDGSIGLEERITNAALRLANNQKGELQLRNNAIQRISNNLKDLLHDMRNRKGTTTKFKQSDRVVDNKLAMTINEQRTFDRTTIKRVTDLARILMQTGYLSDMTSGEMQRLLSIVKNTASKEDITDAVTKIVDIMIDNQLRNVDKDMQRLLKIKGSKVDARGVEVQGALDPIGEQIITSFKKAIKEHTLQEIEGYFDNDGNYVPGILDELKDKVDSDNQVEADNAAIEYSAIELAADYLRAVNESKKEEQALRNELKDELENLAEQKRNKQIPRTAHSQVAEALEDAIRKNKIDRVQAHSDFVSRLTDILRGSIKSAKEFVAAEKDRINNIHHFANSDLQDSDASMQRKETFFDNVKNFLSKTLFNPLGTFEQMVKGLFGGKAIDGMGYLYNHFVRGLNNSRSREIKGYRTKINTLNNKVAELFKGRKYRFGGVKKSIKTVNDLIRFESKLPKIEILYFDKSSQEYAMVELPHANARYIYMVNKMVDGEVKLRKMGISENDVARIAAYLDPQLKEFADWVQDTFLVECRDEYNEVHKRLFGASMANIEDYFPLVTLKDGRNIKEDIDTQDQINGATSIVTSAIKKRKFNVTPLDIFNADANLVLLNHISEMEHWAAFSELGKDMNTLLSYGKFRNRVKNMSTIYGAGETLWKNFKDVARIAFGTYHQDVGSFDKGMLALARFGTAAKVSLRVNTALKQILSLPAILPEISISQLVQDLKNPRNSFKWAMENLPIFEERWKSRIAGDPRLMQTESGWNDWRNNITELASLVGMTPNAFVDAITCGLVSHTIYRTKYAQYIKDGYTAEQADQRAKEDASIGYNLTQQSNEGAYLSTMQAQKTWAATMFTVFRNSPMSYTRQVVDSARNLAKIFKDKEDMQIFMAKQILRDWGEPNIESGINALNRIAAGEDVVYNAMTREDLSQYGGQTGIAFYLGTPGTGTTFKSGFGISHILAKHGADALMHIIDVIAHGEILREVSGNKTVIISKDGYEALIALTRNGEEETWVLSGWNTDVEKEKADVIGKVSASTNTTQDEPILSRLNLGAALSNANVQQYFEDLKSKARENLYKKAIEAAKRRIERTVTKDSIRFITNAFILPGLWTLGGYMWYLAAGDDDDEKKAMGEEALARLSVSPFEGLAGGDMISNIVYSAISGEWNANNMTKEMPISSDIDMFVQHFANDNKAEAINDMVNIITQTIVGVNPQTIENMIMGTVELCGGDMEHSKAALMAVMRILNCPESQIKKLYFDEVGLTGEEASKMSTLELVEQYAKTQNIRSTGVVVSAWDNDESLDKYRKTAQTKIKERLIKQGDPVINQDFDTLINSYSDIKDTEDSISTIKDERPKDMFVKLAEQYSKLNSNSEKYQEYKTVKMFDSEVTDLISNFLEAETPEKAEEIKQDIQQTKAEIVAAIKSGDASELAKAREWLIKKRIKAREETLISQ